MRGVLAVFVAAAVLVSIGLAQERGVNAAEKEAAAPAKAAAVPKAGLPPGLKLPERGGRPWHVEQRKAEGRLGPHKLIEGQLEDGLIQLPVEHGVYVIRWGPPKEGRMITIFGDNTVVVVKEGKKMFAEADGP